MSRHKERSPKPDGFGLLVEKLAPSARNIISALAELRSATSCFETVLVFAKWEESLVYQQVADFSKKLTQRLTHTFSILNDSKGTVDLRSNILGTVIFNLCVDIHSNFRILVSSEKLYSLGVEPGIN